MAGSLISIKITQSSVSDIKFHTYPEFRSLQPTSKTFCFQFVQELLSI